MDECGVDKHLVRESGRAIRGVKVQDVKRGRKFQRTNVMAARNKTDDGNIVHIEPICYNHTTTSIFFVEWFRKKFIRAIPKGSTIIMDNASHHPKARLRNIVRRHGMKIEFLPTYSPDFNPIEKDWANMKRSLVEIMRENEVNTLNEAVYLYFDIEDF